MVVVCGMWWCNKVVMVWCDVVLVWWCCRGGAVVV